MNSKHPVLRGLMADIVLTGIFLCVFALFHHVLPRRLQSQGIVIVPSSSAEESQPSLSPVVSAKPAGKTKGNAGGKASGSGDSKGGSALEEVSDAQTVVDDTPASVKFADQFSQTIVDTETSYKSPAVSVTVSQNTLKTQGAQISYYLADIYLADVTSLQTALAQDAYGTGYRDSILDMAGLSGALLAVNGDYYGNTKEGVVIRNGVLYRANPTNCDVCVLYKNGVLRTMRGEDFDKEQAIEDGAWQAWTFGPALLSANGESIEAFSSTTRLLSANPRTAIGYYEPGHYCFVVVDGRGESAGMTMQQLSTLFETLGCKAAYNLDGGNSSIMVWRDAVINQPSGGGRESSDCLLIKEVATDAGL